MNGEIATKKVTVNMSVYEGSDSESRKHLFYLNYIKEC